MRFLNGCIYKAMLFYKMENELRQPLKIQFFYSLFTLMRN